MGFRPIKHASEDLYVHEGMHILFLLIFVSMGLPLQYHFYSFFGIHYFTF